MRNNSLAQKIHCLNCTVDLCHLNMEDALEEDSDDDYDDMVRVMKRDIDKIRDIHARVMASKVEVVKEKEPEDRPPIAPIKIKLRKDSDRTSTSDGCNKPGRPLSCVLADICPPERQERVEMLKSYKEEV